MTLDDSMLTSDQALRLVGNDPTKAQAALASGRAWSEEQQATLAEIANQNQPSTHPATPAIPAPTWSALAWEADTDTTPSTSAHAKKKTRPWGKKKHSAPSASTATVSHDTNTNGSLEQGQEDLPPQFETGPMPAVAAPQHSSSEAGERPYAPAPDTPARGLPTIHHTTTSVSTKRKRNRVILPLILLAATAAAVTSWWMTTPHTAAPSSEATALAAEITDTSGEETAPAEEAAPATAPQTAIQAGSGSWLCATTPNAPGVSCWGAGSDQSTLPPTTITGLENTTITHLAVGRGFAVATDEGGGVWAWGNNDQGQLGPDATPPDTTTATKIGDLPAPADTLMAATEHACATSSGQVYCFGSNRFGQVTGTPTTASQPLTHISDITNATSVASSGYDTFVTTPDGIWAWGSNQWGQTDPTAPGTATPPHQLTPTN